MLGLKRGLASAIRRLKAPEFFHEIFLRGTEMKPAGEKRGQYEAVVYTINGVDTQCYFDDLTQAHEWITKEYERLRKMDVECAYEIYDYKPNKTRIFVSDKWFLLSEQNPA
jgi:hypothetical protein